MKDKRIQLTLFVDEKEAIEIEKLRKAFNPLQYELIKSHVTLCREDELSQIEAIILKLKNTTLEAITINFGSPIRFSNENGVLIEAIGDNLQFHNLRKNILNGHIEKAKIQEPHITLMHPRNATCTDEIFSFIAQASLPTQIRFDKISLIQQEMGMKWHILEEFKLND